MSTLFELRRHVPSARPACLLAMGQKVIRKRLPRYIRGFVRRKHRKTVILSSSYTAGRQRRRRGIESRGRRTYDYEYTVRLKEWDVGGKGRGRTV